MDAVTSSRFPREDHAAGPRKNLPNSTELLVWGLGLDVGAGAGDGQARASTTGRVATAHRPPALAWHGMAWPNGPRRRRQRIAGNRGPAPLAFFVGRTGNLIASVGWGAGTQTCSPAHAHPSVQHPSPSSSSIVPSCCLPLSPPPPLV